MADMGTGNKILVLSQVKSVVNHAATYWYLFLTVSSTLRLRVFVDFLRLSQNSIKKATFLVFTPLNFFEAIGFQNFPLLPKEACILAT